jgi:hypothetical protein
MLVLGTQLAMLAAQTVLAFGQPVLITPSAARLAAGQGAFTATALIEAPDPTSVQQFRQEGDQNTDNADAHCFTFSGDAGVQEGDTATYKGVRYKLFNAPQQDLQAVSIVTMCIGLRVK